MRSKHNSKRIRTLRRRRLALALVSAMAAPMAMAQSACPECLPYFGQVVSGSGSATSNYDMSGVIRPTSDASTSTMTITQTTRGAIIDWSSFNIGSGYEVRFLVPDASGVTLNRVVGFMGPGYGVSSSMINGTLSSNGNVFIINPAGITFAGGSQITVGGLVASTLWLSDGDFDDGLATGSYIFSGFNGDPAPTHQVRNDGDITAGAGGVGFVGSTLWNSGSITANRGNIVFGAGSQVTLDSFGDGLTQVTVNVPPTFDSGIIQDRYGSMTADGGKILLRTAATAGGTGGAILASGNLRAQTMANVNGRIELTSAGGPVMLGAPGIFSDVGSPFTHGSIDVSGGAGETGGSVLISGNGVTLVNDDDTPQLPTDPFSIGSSIDASGLAGGGDITISSMGDITAMQLASINASGVNDGRGGTIDLYAIGDVTVSGDMLAWGGVDGGSISITGAAVDFASAVAYGSTGLGGSVSVTADDIVMTDASTAINVRGETGGGSIDLEARDSLVLGQDVSLSADSGSSGSGGSIRLHAGSSLAVYGELSARGVSSGGSIHTGSGGGIDLDGIGIDAGTVAGDAGTWTIAAPQMTVLNGSTQGTVGTGPIIATSTDIQDGDLNNAFATGTNIVLQATGGDVQFDDAQILATFSSPLSLQVNATGAIYGSGFSIDSSGGALEMLFNADSAGGNGSGGYIDFSNASLASNGGLIAMYGQSDQAAGFASGYANGIALVDVDIDSAGGGVALSGHGTGGGSGVGYAGVTLDGSDIDSGGGNLAINGTGTGSSSGVIARNGSIRSEGGQLVVTGTADGPDANGVYLDGVFLFGGSGDVAVDGASPSGIGTLFANGAGVSTTTGAITLIGIGESVGLSLDGGDFVTESGHIDLRGRGLGANSDGLLIGSGISIATNNGGIDLSGEGGSRAGLGLGASSTIDAGNSLVVLRAGNDGSSDAIRLQGAIHSGVGVNLRPGGVDANGGLTERVNDEIRLAGGATGFALSGAELAMIDSPELIIGSSLHAGSIQVLGTVSRDGNLTLQNDGGAGGIDIQAALGVGNGTLALSSGGSIIQTSTGAITAHSLLANAGGNVLLANAQNNVAATTLAGSSGGAFEFQDIDALAVGSVSALGFDAASGGLSSLGAIGIDAEGNVLVQNLAGDLILNEDIQGNNIDLVTAGRLQNLGDASLIAARDWRVWATTWEGETRGGLAGSGDLPNLYGCQFLGSCGVTVPATDNHFVYVQQPTALIAFNNFSREYGLPNPGFTFTVNGAILGDTATNVATGTGSTTATIFSDVGNYAINGVFTSAAGYRIQLQAGSLAITPAMLFFTADSATRYLGSPNPNFTGTVTGFRNSDSVESVFGTTDIWSSPANFFSQVGFHPINGGTTAKNYVFIPAPGNATALQIIPLPQLSSTPIDLIRETINTYVYDRNFGGAPMCAINASLDDQRLASSGDELSNEWSKVRSRPNLTNCFDTERQDSCGSF